VVVKLAGVQPVLGEGIEAAIEPRSEVGVGIKDLDVATGHAETGDRDETKKCPVADEQSGGDCDENCGAAACVPDSEADKSCREVAGCDAGENPEDTQMCPVEVRERGEEHLDGEDGGCPAEDVAGERGAAVAAGHAGLRRENDGDADEKEEAGEDEVGEGEAVPGGVVKLRVDVGPVAGIVDEDHQGDGEATQDVDGLNTRSRYVDCFDAVGGDGRCGGLHEKTL
jgi:hypothetical protein